MPDIQFDLEAVADVSKYIATAKLYFESPVKEYQVDGTPYGVDKSTIRSFHGIDKPLNTYNSWAHRNVNQVYKAIGIEEKALFNKWYENLNANVSVTFNDRINVAQKHKLIDLFLKWCARNDQVSSSVRAALIKNAYCPLDSYSLRLLDRIAPGTVINRKPSMGDVTTEMAYQYIQTVIQEICVKLDCMPLHFDYLAWNTEH